jgi:hypothetical protein
MLPKSLSRDGPTSLFATISTIGPESFVAVCSAADAGRSRNEAPFAEDIRPIADVEFPSKKSGDPPIRKRFALNRFCCDGLYHGPVSVPEDAGVGVARVTFSFDSWKEAKVMPTTVTIPIDDPTSSKFEPNK